MSPVKVIYTRQAPPDCFDPEPGTVVINRISAQTIRELREGIEAGTINGVVLVGPQTAMGWRIYISRPIEFSSAIQAPAMLAHATPTQLERVQAEQRIVTRLQ